MTQPSCEKQQTTLTLTELFELGYLRVIEIGPVQADVRAHQLISCEGPIKTHLKCKVCGFKTNTPSDLRKNKGCNMFSNRDTNPRGIYWTVKSHDRGMGTGLADEPAVVDKGWVRYPKVGRAWQEDKFINEEVKRQTKKYDH